MSAQQKLYLKSGFKPLRDAPGATGHSGCNRFYLLELRMASARREVRS